MIIIVQENRSFDNLFAGYPGADTQSYGYTTTGKKVTLKAITMKTDLGPRAYVVRVLPGVRRSGKRAGHSMQDGRINLEAVKCGHAFEPPCPTKYPQYAYVPHNETDPYFEMAKQYVLADRMFESNLDGSSFVSHQYIIAGQASSSVNFPTSLWGCDGGPSDTIATLLQSRQIGAYDSGMLR